MKRERLYLHYRCRDVFLYEYEYEYDVETVQNSLNAIKVEAHNKWHTCIGFGDYFESDAKDLY